MILIKNCYYFLFYWAKRLHLYRVCFCMHTKQNIAIRTVANSLPENEVILLTLLISKRYIPYTDLRKNLLGAEGRGIFNEL